MDKQIQNPSQTYESATHKLFSAYVQAIQQGRKNEVEGLEKECRERRLCEPDTIKRAGLCRAEVLIDIAFAEQAMQDKGNPFFALCENEHARDKLKIAEKLEPGSAANKVLDDMLRTSFYDSTHLPEFQIFYPGGFPIDSRPSQSYYQVEPAPRIEETPRR